jgi:photosystem II stability/assembly factor-like uncharacterized protein
VATAGADGATGEDSGAGCDGTAGCGGTQLAFQKQILSTSPLTPIQIWVDVENASGALIPTPSTVITLAIGANPGGANLLGSTTAPAINGMATFAAVGLDKPGAGYTLVASSPGLPSVTSNPFTVTQPSFAPVTTGLWGGAISSISIGGGTQPVLYVSTSGGVYRSTNNAGTWTWADFGDPNPGRVIVNPENTSIAYTAGGLVGVTTNGGASWAAVAAGGQSASCLAIDPANPSVLYTGSARSTDGGNTWTATGLGYLCNSLAVDPVTPSTLYALAHDDTNTSLGVFKSVDSGATWGAVNNMSLPAPSSLNESVVFATPTGVFVSAIGQTFRSTDGGASWSQLAGGVIMGGGGVAYAPSNVMRVYLATPNAVEGTVLVSNDGGATFGAAVDVNGGLVSGLAVDPMNADRVYAATATGVFLSTDGGMTWAGASTGIPLVSVSAVTLNPSAPATVLVGGPSAIYRTTDTGLTWSQTPLVAGDPVKALALDPANPSNAYACTLSATFYRSSDGGATWSSGVSTGGGTYCDSIAVHGQTLWATSVLGGVRRSTDGGVTWAATGLTLPTYSVAVDPTGTTLYAGTNAGTYKSLDSGSTWSLLPPVATDIAGAVLIDPVTPSIVYEGLSCGMTATAGGGSGIKRSTDSGATWSSSVGGACVSSMLGLPSGALFALGSGAVEKSTDQGLSWLSLAGAPNASTGGGMAVTDDANTIYLGTSTGLYRSVTGGM